MGDWVGLMSCQGIGGSLRGEVAAFACEDGDVDVFTLGYLSHAT